MARAICESSSNQCSVLVRIANATRKRGSQWQGDSRFAIRNGKAICDITQCCEWAPPASEAHSLRDACAAPDNPPPSTRPPRLLPRAQLSLLSSCVCQPSDLAQHTDWCVKIPPSINDATTMFEWYALRSQALAIEVDLRLPYHPARPAGRCSLSMASGRL